MKLAGWIALVLIVLVFGLYYNEFGINQTILTDEKDVWGQFGDYFGGVLNPILSFISICLLIQSIRVQSVANRSIFLENKRQQDLDNKKSFEFRFYNLIEAQKSSLANFSVKVPALAGADKQFGQGDAAQAVNKIEEIIRAVKFRTMSSEDVTRALEELDERSGDSIYSFARRFYLLIRLIDVEVVTDNGFASNDRYTYTEILINLSDFSAVRLLCICLAHLNWPSVKYMNEFKELQDVINDTGLVEYIEGIR
ncbi:hypothetical protein [Cronobacter sakazakii]|uniref:hypothetical protein n=1 Tax=Cronobacter sakazakii TaxID=28141 RepID=UPI00294AE674|nr:hypothetical protein [Cronobacter sakazakii]